MPSYSFRSIMAVLKVRTFTRIELLYQHPLIPHQLGMRFKGALAKLRCRTTQYVSRRPQISRNLFDVLFICCARVHFAVAGICDLSF